MLGEHDSNVGVPLTAGQEERRAPLLGTTLDVGVAGDQQLSQLKEPFLCGQSEWALPGRGREGGREEETVITIPSLSIFLTTYAIHC